MPGSDDKNREELIGKMRTLADKRGETPEQMFHAYDKDHTGGLTSAELVKLLEDARVGNGITRHTWAARIFEKVDKDRDRNLTLEELSGVIATGDPPPPPSEPTPRPPPMGPPRGPMGPPRPPPTPSPVEASTAGDWVWLLVIGGLVWAASRG
jgi:hypothetical protein